MSRLPATVRASVEPLIALAFVAFWVAAEAGRAHPLGFWVGLALYGVAIGVARLLPAVSLGILVGVPVLQLIGVLSPPEATTWPVYAAALAVAFVVGSTAGARLRWFALAAILVQIVVIGAVMVLRGDWISWIGAASIGSGAMVYLPNSMDAALPLVVIGALLGLAAWTAGFALHVTARRRADQELIAQAEADLAVADVELRGAQERSEIAQEVHDVLAHSLAVVIAVADGSRFLRAARSGPGGAPATTEGAAPAGDARSLEALEDETDVALREIADTARSALGDLRGLLEGLHDSAGEWATGGDRPQPALADLPALVERMSMAGMRVSVDHVGAVRPLTRAQELSVYRIVQESLTNALKHGGEHPEAAVSFAWQGEGLALTVVSGGNDAQDAAGSGRPDGAAAPARSFGIQGMKDRAHLAGGWLTAQPDDDGSFIVTAFVPVREGAGWAA